MGWACSWLSTCLQAGLLVLQTDLKRSLSLRQNRRRDRFGLFHAKSRRNRYCYLYCHYSSLHCYRHRRIHVLLSSQRAYSCYCFLSWLKAAWIAFLLLFSSGSVESQYTLGEQAANDELSLYTGQHSLRGSNLCTSQIFFCHIVSQLASHVLQILRIRSSNCCTSCEAILKLKWSY